MPAYLLLPLIASWFYVLGVLLVKRSGDYGVGVYRTTFVANIITGIVFLPLLLMGGSFPGWEHVWQPAVTALLFVGGQVLTFQALNKGDVSIATPVLGVKIILVALFTTLLTAESVPLKLWISSVMSVAAIGLLNQGGQKKEHHHVTGTIVAAGAAALLFALFDVFVQKYSPRWGAGRFLPLMMAMVAAFSLAFIPLFHAPLRAIPRPAWKWLVGGGFFMSAQAVLFISTLAIYGKATASNIIYSSRGLWSVVAVWLIGHWFKNQEQQLGASVLKWRLAGAVLMLAAIVMVLGK
jgi:drug/metabolite transporter (DMT)-like permease